MSTSGITYELALALKEAGFPQKGDHMKLTGTNEYISIPTLSELIEACGEKFKCLENNTDDWCAVGGNKLATSSTPEEAVASLYIALYEKDKKN